MESKGATFRPQGDASDFWTGTLTGAGVALGQQLVSQVPAVQNDGHYFIGINILAQNSTLQTNLQLFINDKPAGRAPVNGTAPLGSGGLLPSVTSSLVLFRDLKIEDVVQVKTAAAGEATTAIYTVTIVLTRVRFEGCRHCEGP